MLKNKLRCYVGDMGQGHQNAESTSEELAMQKRRNAEQKEKERSVIFICTYVCMCMLYYIYCCKLWIINMYVRTYVIHLVCVCVCIYVLVYVCTYTCAYVFLLRIKVDERFKSAMKEVSPSHCNRIIYEYSHTYVHMYIFI